MNIELVDLMKSVNGTLEKDETFVMIRVGGKDDSFDESLDEAVKKIKACNSAGYDSNDDGNYSFEVVKECWGCNYDQPFSKLDKIIADELIADEKSFDDELTISKNKTKHVLDFIKSYQSK